MKFLSVCSGIEAASVAWDPLGFEAVGFSEIETFPCRLLAHRYPEIPNLGDMTKFHEWPDTLRFNILVGGTPCQAFSIAGKREGLEDPRGQLMLTYVEIAARYRPKWVVWENVPGVLSANKGQDFASFLGLLTGRKIHPPQGGWKNSGIIPGHPAAYGVAWRTIDAQYCGVPQRRRRVFVIGYLGDWKCAAAVLFEPESMRGDSPPCRGTGKSIAGTLSARTEGGGGLGTDFDLAGGVQVAGTLSANGKAAGSATQQDAESGMLVVQPLRAQSQCAHDDSKETYITHTLKAEHDTSEDGTGRGTPLIPVAFDPQGAGNQTNLGASTEGTGALGTTKTPAIAFSVRDRGDDGRGYDRDPQIFKEDQVGTLDTVKPHCVALAEAQCVRRLTPLECERLQGFPDNWTLIPPPANMKFRLRVPEGHLETVAYLIAAGFSKEDAEALADHPDGPRYKAIGNSMAVPVMKWIGERIQGVEGMVSDE